MISRCRALAIMACAGVIFAACGNSPSTPRRTTTTSRAPTSTTTTSSSSTTTTSAPPTSTTVATAACAQITAASSPGQGAAGTITGTITVTNAGSSPCRADGYPTVALFSGSGAPLTVTMVNGLSVTVSPPANAPPSSVTVAPSSTAQFTYQYSDVPVGNETSCPASEMARVTMPGSTTPSPAFALAIAPCGNGTVKVSPVYAG